MRDTLVEQIVGIQSAYASLLEEVSEALTGNQSIIPQWGIVLLCIGEREMTPSQLRKSSYYVGTNIAYFTRQMKSAGLITEAHWHGDRKVRPICLTEKGLAIAEKIRAHFARRPARRPARDEAAGIMEWVG